MVITINVPDTVANRVVNALCAGQPTATAAAAQTALIGLITQMVQSVETRAATTTPPLVAPITGLS